jgi:predicted transcriptional regulator
MKALKVGIASYEEMKARTMAIARGTLKPKPGDPKVWFPSAESLVRVLSDKNRMLLGTIRDAEPQSLADLAELTGRHKSNLSRTLKTMARYGLVELDHKSPHGSLVASVPWESVTVDLPLGSR